ncbi:MAG TPA: hypothetical protein VMU08_08510 [Rhizomicrobium sp.]|nr:hypothetical protein [Rhizomicrobium sp.]
MKRTAIAILVAILSTPAFAIGPLPRDADHLAPSEEVVAGYEAAVSHVLSRAFAPDVDVIAFVEPAFAPEFAVGMRLKDGTYRVFVLSADEQVWPHLLKGEAIDRIGANYCETPVPAGLAVRIDRVWDAMMRRVGPGAANSVGIDSAHYNFTKIVDGELVVGSAWDQQDSTRVGKLQGIAQEMNLLCKTPGRDSLDRLAMRVDALAAQLNLAPSENPQ